MLTNRRLDYFPFESWSNVGLPFLHETEKHLVTDSTEVVDQLSQVVVALS